MEVARDPGRARCHASPIPDMCPRPESGLLPECRSFVPYLQAGPDFPDASRARGLISAVRRGAAGDGTAMRGRLVGPDRDLNFWVPDQPEKHPENATNGALLVVRRAKPACCMG